MECMTFSLALVISQKNAKKLCKKNAGILALAYGVSQLTLLFLKPCNLAQISEQFLHKCIFAFFGQVSCIH